MDLSEASVEDLMAEVQRRLECQSKPEKRVILVGMRRFCFPFINAVNYFTAAIVFLHLLGKHGFLIS